MVLSALLGDHEGISCTSPKVAKLEHDPHELYEQPTDDRIRTTITLQALHKKFDVMGTCLGFDIFLWSDRMHHPLLT